MGLLSVTVLGQERRLTALADTVIGRAASCSWTLGPPLYRSTSSRIPRMWLVVRWSRDIEAWEVQTLPAEEHTAEAGPATTTARKRWGVRQPIVLPDGVASVELIHAGPPTAALVDPATGEVLEGPALSASLEERVDGWWPVAGGDQPLLDGQIHVEDGRPWRFFQGVPAAGTEGCPIDLASEAAVVEFGAPPALIRVRQGARASSGFTGAPVEVAIHYLRARLEDAPPGGWLFPADVAARIAHDRGEKVRDTRVAFVGEQRSRFVRMLTDTGIANAPLLFDVRPGRDSRARIRLPPYRLRLLPGQAR